MLEWVNDTSTLRSLIIESHTTLSDTRDFPLPDIQQFHVEFANQQVEKQKDIGALIQMYNFFVGEYRPCLHRWFLDKFQVKNRNPQCISYGYTTIRDLSLHLSTHPHTESLSDSLSLFIEQAFPHPRSPYPSIFSGSHGMAGGKRSLHKVVRGLVSSRSYRGIRRSTYGKHSVGCNHWRMRSCGLRLSL